MSGEDAVEQIIGAKAETRTFIAEGCCYLHSVPPRSIQPLYASWLNLPSEEGEAKMLHRKFQSKSFSSLLLGVFLTFLFISTVAAQEQGKLIEAIDFLGNRRLTDEEILQHIKTRPGELFDAKRTQEDLQSLLKLGLFDASQTKVLTEVGVRGGINVLFEIRELPFIVEVVFDGLRYVTKEELLAELREQKVEVTVNSPFQPKKLQKVRRVITEYLAKKRGFTDAKVEITTEEVSATTLKVSFVIDEMPNDDEDCGGK